MVTRFLAVLAFGLVAVGGCQTTSSDSVAMASPEPETYDSQRDETSSTSDQTDPGVRAGKAGDDELPEGVRMLGDREDPTALNVSADDDNILCKRMGVTGSRVTTQRVCKTRREWRDEAQQTNRGVRRQLDRNQKGKPQG